MPQDLRTILEQMNKDGHFVDLTRNPLVVVPNLVTGPEMVHAYRVGRTRFTYTGTVDLRVEKGFGIGGQRAAIRLDAFNLTNHPNEVEEDVVTGPNFRRSTAVQPPLTLRFGLRFEF